MSWVPEPARVPHRCYAIRQGGADNGPFWDSGMDYFAPYQDEQGQLRVNPKLQRLYLAARAFTAIADEPGCPFVVLDRAEHEAQAERMAHLEAECADLEAERDAARAERDAARAERDELRAHQAAPVDVDALARGVVALMDKPKTTRGRRS